MSLYVYNYSLNFDIGYAYMKCLNSNLLICTWLAAFIYIPGLFTVVVFCVSKYNLQQFLENSFH